MHTKSWLNPKLERRSSDKQGIGIFARDSVQAGERLAIFGGSILMIDELYEFPEELQRFPMQIEERFLLASTHSYPEDADFFNHSCDPNSGFKGQIFLVAMRDIRPGEEITFDYAMTVSESVGSNIVFRMECGCGSPHCRKIITEQDWKIPELQDRYRGFFSQYIQDKIDMLYGEGTE